MQISMRFLHIDSPPPGVIFAPPLSFGNLAENKGFIPSPGSEVSTKVDRGALFEPRASCTQICAMRAVLRRHGADQAPGNAIVALAYRRPFRPPAGARIATAGDNLTRTPRRDFLRLRRGNHPTRRNNNVRSGLGQLGTLVGLRLFLRCRRADYIGLGDRYRWVWLRSRHGTLSLPSTPAASSAGGGRRGA
jgi:hypothetical protein